jgi:response regulator of citrate/malate metabolism
VKKALIVEDDPQVQSVYRLYLEEAGFQVVGEAVNLEEARKIFQKHLDAKVAIIDGMIEDGVTDRLVREVLDQGFQGVLIGISGDRASELLEAGCQVTFTKSETTRKLLKILELISRIP